MESVRVSVVGPAGVGKSALVVRLITGRFLHHYDPTLEDEYTTTLNLHGHLHQLTILDTAGQESKQLEYYCKNSDVVIVAFSIVDSHSLQQAMQMFEQLHCPDICTVLVGTKADLKAEREVSRAEACLAAGQFSSPYVETSAASSINVRQLFNLAANLVLNARKESLNKTI